MRCSRESEKERRIRSNGNSREKTRESSYCCRLRQFGEGAMAIGKRLRSQDRLKKEKPKIAENAAVTWQKESV